MIKGLVHLTVVLSMLAPIVSHAETVVRPHTFEELSAGKTFYFYRKGVFFGAEQYLENRQSLWQFQDGTRECLTGTWFAKDDYICFTYLQDPRVQCWNFLQKEAGFSVRGKGSPPELDIDLSHIDDEPLDCAGPGFGV